MRRFGVRAPWLRLATSSALALGVPAGAQVPAGPELDPAYILYDEPTTGLDPIMADVINRLIRALQARIGVTSIVVTHDLHSAWHVRDRLAMLHGGRVGFAGTPSEARETKDPLVRQFIEGTSEGAITAV